MEMYDFPPAPLQEKPRETFFNKFLEAGKEGKNEWWRYLVGIILTFFVGYSLIGVVPLLLLAVRGTFLHYFTLEEVLSSQVHLQDASYLHVSKNVLLACLLFIFVAGMFFLWIAVKFLHKKRFMAVIASDKQSFSFKRYLFAFSIYLALSIVSFSISYFSNPQAFTLVFQPMPFLGSLLVCVLMLPIQTGWEEIFMRGYLFQGLGLWMKKPIFPLIITSVLFGLLHMENAEVAANGVAKMLPAYIFPGLIFGMIVLLDERLELAMGLHFANNLFGILTVTSPDMSIQANSIWSIPSSGGTFDMILGNLPLLVVIILFWKKYKWNFAKLYR